MSSGVQIRRLRPGRREACCTPPGIRQIRASPGPGAFLARRAAGLRTRGGSHLPVAGSLQPRKCYFATLAYRDFTGWYNYGYNEA